MVAVGTQMSVGRLLLLAKNRGSNPARRYFGVCSLFFAEYAKKPEGNNRLRSTVGWDAEAYARYKKRSRYRGERGQTTDVVTCYTACSENRQVIHVYKSSPARVGNGVECTPRTC